MLFKAERVVTGLVLDVRDTKLVDFRLNAGPLTTITFRRIHEEERRQWHVGDEVICTVVIDREPSAKVARMFQALAGGRMPPGSRKWTPPDSVFEIEAPVDEAGNIRPGHGAPWDLMPPAYQDFARDVSSMLYERGNQLVRVQRWRLGTAARHNPAGEPLGVRWSLDGERWDWLPLHGSVRAGVGVVPRPKERERSDILALVDAGKTEPLAHELYREATYQQDQNPRSALLMSMAAAEVGLKQCIATLAPDTAWLVERIPTPRLQLMLEGYLPKLRARCDFAGKVLPPPRPVLKSLEKGSALRNKVAHAGAVVPTWDELDEVLAAVRDLLWLLDYYCGHAWALEHLREETRLALLPSAGTIPAPVPAAVLATHGGTA